MVCLSVQDGILDLQAGGQVVFGGQVKPISVYQYPFFLWTPANTGVLFFPLPEWPRPGGFRPKSDSVRYVIYLVTILLRITLCLRDWL